MLNDTIHFNNMQESRRFFVFFPFYFFFLPKNEMLGRITLLSKQQSGFLMFVQRIAIFFIILNNVLYFILVVLNENICVENMENII